MYFFKFSASSKDLNVKTFATSGNSSIFFGNEPKARINLSYPNRDNLLFNLSRTISSLFFTSISLTSFKVFTITPFLDCKVSGVKANNSE